MVRLVRLLSNPRKPLVAACAPRPMAVTRRTELPRSRQISKLTAGERLQLVELYNQGWTVPRLSQHVGAHGQTIREILIAEGCEALSMSSRSLTEAQIAVAISLRRDGQTIARIAESLGGTDSSVRRALKIRRIERGVR